MLFNLRRTTNTCRSREAALADRAIHEKLEAGLVYLSSLIP
jgi:hypothetical protein